MLTTILWWYYYPHVAAREMEAMRLSNLPEVRGSWWRSRKQNASSSAPPRIFLPQHCHLVPKALALFCLMWAWDRYRERGEKSHFALHLHRLWWCHQAYMCANLHDTLWMHKKPVFRISSWCSSALKTSLSNSSTAIGILQRSPPGNNPSLPLSNHFMDNLATLALVTKQGQGSFPNTETNLGSIATPLLSTS